MARLNLIGYTNLFSPNESEKNDNIKIFSIIWNWKFIKNQSIVLSVISIKNLKTSKYHTFFDKRLILSIICGKWGSKNEKVFKEEESIETLKVLSLIKTI